MKQRKFKYIYGPVSSWRLGRSLGIDPISSKEKVCTFDCVYCQLGETFKFDNMRKIYVKTSEIIKEINRVPKIPIDHITFSGRGEPTLAKNLGEMIEAIKSFRSEKIAVLTNSSLMEREDVQRDLLKADFVVAKLDACYEELFMKINRPMWGIFFDFVLSGIKKFRAEYHGRFALQIMFIEENKNSCEKLAKIVKEIEPDEVQINTPLRPCEAKPLSEEEISTIKEYFIGLNPISVYEKERKETVPISSKETLVRRGKIA
ncbi:MAG TPA: radical SAM protein [Nitrospinota bacterium]|nr:radical SAM protein [Nitrospinota bacterium]